MKENLLCCFALFCSISPILFVGIYLSVRRYREYKENMRIVQYNKERLERMEKSFQDELKWNEWYYSLSDEERNKGYIYKPWFPKY